MKGAISLERARRVVHLLDAVRCAPNGEAGRVLAVSTLIEELGCTAGAALLEERSGDEVRIIAQTVIGATIEQLRAAEPDRSSAPVLRSVRCPGPGRVECMAFARAPGGKPFADEDATVVRLFHLEAPSLFAEPRVGLPPRLQHTFEGLLDGAADKDIALRVGLSVHTVREYVKSILRAYGVRSRAELLARHLARGPRPVPAFPSRPPPAHVARPANANGVVSREARAAPRA